MEKGVLYTAVGRRYVLEARASVRSLDKHCPGLHATLFTDHRSCSEREAKAFDDVVWIKPSRVTGMAKLTKISALTRSPYEHTLFLDADTYICDDISGMFELLDWYDILFAFSSRRKSQYNPEDIPDWFTERSSGAILYRNTPEVIKLFKHWGRLYRKYHNDNKCTSDQVSLRTALFNNKTLRVGTLAPEWHCFIPCPISLAGRVYILHGRGDMAALAVEVNTHDAMRVYLPRFGIINRKQFDAAMALKIQSQFIMFDIPEG